eukprot:gnl/TRDRNA2_/TRDRNA2_159767_c0_seq1.p1 gnl/TRDRNA2_/TRDRNA2_159767_c0~~gnl/TRDRNA2_/TRDRNA2_159767_c0_seq1.p1  ORF type:complete len:290 (+),score=45.01 gnl/TRDRNA2_/TRDRNA2_159767_c0_seq1:77-946(+)
MFEGGSCQKVVFGVTGPHKRQNKLDLHGLKVPRGSVLDMRAVFSNSLDVPLNSTLSLREAALQLLGFIIHEDEEIFYSDWTNADLEIGQINLAAMDAWVTLRLHWAYMKQQRLQSQAERAGGNTTMPANNSKRNSTRQRIRKRKREQEEESDVASSDLITLRNHIRTLRSYLEPEIESALRETSAAEANASVAAAGADKAEEAKAGNGTVPSQRISAGSTLASKALQAAEAANALTNSTLALLAQTPFEGTSVYAAELAAICAGCIAATAVFHYRAPASNAGKEPLLFT